MLPSEIHHPICHVYGDNVMSDGMVRKCVWMFNEGRENVHAFYEEGIPKRVPRLDKCLNNGGEYV